MIKSLVTDVNGTIAHIDKDKDYGNALIVATRELKDYSYAFKFFVNDTYGINMNKNGSLSATVTELIYDEDVGAPGEWNMSTIVGTAASFIYDSVVQHYHGSVSIDARGSNDGYIAQAAKGSSFSLVGYQFLTGYIYITTWAVAGTKQVLLYGWDTAGATMVGNSVNIGNYVNTTQFNVWQKFTIPLTDMMLTNETIDALRIQTVDIGTGLAPDYFLDYMKFEGSATGGGNLDYIVEPNPDSRLYVYNMYTTFVASYSGTLSDATMPKIPYDSFLGLGPLASGMLFRVIKDNENLYTIVFRNLFDIMSFTRSTITDFGSDGTNTWFKLNLQFDPPFFLNSTGGDKIIITIRDDMSSLLGFRTTLNGRTEYYVNGHGGL